MDPDAAALEAIRSALDSLGQRVASMADARRDDPDDPLVSDLDELERALRAATRRLDRTLRRLD